LRSNISHPNETRLISVEKETVELIARARQGDATAFRRIVDLHSRRLHAIAFQITGDSNDARDVVQEVFLRLYRSMDKYDPKYDFAAWLHRVAVNLSIDHHRRNARRRHVPLDDITAADASPVTESIGTGITLKGAIRKLSDKLSDNQRKVFVLRDLQNFSTGEVAAILGLKPDTVRKHLAGARLRIRKALVKHYPDLCPGPSKGEGIR
jgi:RNA polymerase sigma-70 factor (ECF subfamily)